MNRWPHQSVLGIFVFAVGTLLLACGGDDSTAPADGSTFDGTIRVIDNRFSPASVTISVGDSITWRWEGSHSHTVTQGTSDSAPPIAQKLFDSPLQITGTFGYRFTATGTVPYYCRPHLTQGMKATVTVQP